MADSIPNRRGKHKTYAPPLSAPEIRFCLRLMAGDTQRQAYKGAGFTHSPNDEATDKAASRLVRKREVRQFLRRLQDEAARGAMMTAERIGVLVGTIATLDFRRIMAPNGTFLPTDRWPDDVAAALGEIESRELFQKVSDGVDEAGKKKPKRRELVGYVRKVKVNTAKVAALRLLMEWKGMIGQNREADGKAATEPLVVGGEADPGAI